MTVVQDWPIDIRFPAIESRTRTLMDLIGLLTTIKCVRCILHGDYRYCPDSYAVELTRTRKLIKVTKV